MGPTLRYIGLDISRPMLREFRRRSEADRVEPTLIEADGNRSWPVADAVAHIVFSSRALHLLDHDHVVGELFRVASARDAVLLTGRVRRAEDSVRERMRREMRRLLSSHGVEGRDRRAGRRAVFDLCRARGAEELRPRVAASWTVARAPGQSIEAWQGKEGLAGIEVPARIKQEVLHTLSAWARKHEEDLRTPVETEESYLLEGMRMPLRSGG